jgi:hypothetical protein
MRHPSQLRRILYMLIVNYSLKLLKQGSSKWVRNYRVGRVRSFFSSRRNCDSPTPHPQASVPPPPLVRGGGGAHSLAGEGVGESQFRRGNIQCGTLKRYICTLWLASSLLSAVVFLGSNPPVPLLPSVFTAPSLPLS